MRDNAPIFTMVGTADFLRLMVYATILFTFSSYGVWEMEPRTAARVGFLCGLLFSGVILVVDAHVAGRDGKKE